MLLNLKTTNDTIVALSSKHIEILEEWSDSIAIFMTGGRMYNLDKKTNPMKDLTALINRHY